MQHLDDPDCFHWEMVQCARERLAGHVRHTPVLASQTIDSLVGATVLFKCENFQKTGSFKARGATNAVLSLSDSVARHGVTTHSSGNHAAALAMAAASRGIPAYIVMPSNASKAKQDSVRRYGGVVTLCEPTRQSREHSTALIAHETGATIIHAYDDHSVMAGQATTAVELLDTHGAVDFVLCPVGGGGHIAGISLAASVIAPKVKVIGVEPAGADDAVRSLRERRLVEISRPSSIADGLLTSLGKRPFGAIIRHVEDIVSVSEEAILVAMRMIWSVLKIIVEPSAAVVLAALLEKAVPVRGTTALILTGGNVDLDRLPWMAQKQAGF